METENECSRCDMSKENTCTHCGHTGPDVDYIDNPTIRRQGAKPIIMCRDDEACWKRWLAGNRPKPRPEGL